MLERLSGRLCVRILHASHKRPRQIPLNSGSILVGRWLARQSLRAVAQVLMKLRANECTATAGEMRRLDEQKKRPDA